MDGGQSELNFSYTDHQRVAEEDVTDQVRAAHRKIHIYRPDFEDRQEELENHIDEYREEDDADGMDFAVRERDQYDPVENGNNGEGVDNQDDSPTDVLDEEWEEDDSSSEMEEEEHGSEDDEDTSSEEEEYANRDDNDEDSDEHDDNGSGSEDADEWKGACYC